ncbi:MAG: acyl-CoA reductase [Pseudobdellovibrio sp.]
MLNKTFQFGQIVNLEQPLDSVDLKKLLQTGKKQLLKTPPKVDQVIEILVRVGTIWMNTESSVHLRIKEQLKAAGIIGSSVDLFFNEALKFFSKIVLEQRWEKALGNKNTNPVGMVLHVGATNTLVAGLDGLIDGLLAGNINFYKFSTADGGIAGMLFESILAVDIDKIIAKRLVAFWWKGGDKKIESIFKANMDVIIVWGGVDAIMSWKANLGFSARIISHGPKCGIGILTAAGLKESSLEELCKNIVMDVSMWDQKACNNLQTLFIEEAISKEILNSFFECLQFTFQKIYDDAVPVRTADEYIDIMNARELIKAEFLISSGVKLIAPMENTWTLAYWTKWKSGLMPTPLCRFLNIINFSNLEFILDGLSEEKYWMQTMGYCISKNETEKLVNTARALGITRICSFGNMVLPSTSQPHDGNYDLNQLVQIMAMN